MCGWASQEESAARPDCAGGAGDPPRKKGRGRFSSSLHVGSVNFRPGKRKPRAFRGGIILLHSLSSGGARGERFAVVLSLPRPPYASGVSRTGRAATTPRPAGGSPAVPADPLSAFFFSPPGVTTPCRSFASRRPRLPFPSRPPSRPWRASRGRPLQRCWRKPPGCGSLYDAPSSGRARRRTSPRA